MNSNLGDETLQQGMQSGIKRIADQRQPSQYQGSLLSLYRFYHPQGRLEMEVGIGWRVSSQETLNIEPQGRFFGQFKNGWGEGEWGGLMAGDASFTQGSLFAGLALDRTLLGGGLLLTPAGQAWGGRISLPLNAPLYLCLVGWIQEKAWSSGSGFQIGMRWTGETLQYEQDDDLSSRKSSSPSPNSPSSPFTPSPRSPSTPSPTHPPL